MAHFNIKILLVFPVFVVLAKSQISVDTNPQMGKFSTPKGAECMWLNDKSKTSDISLMIACWCENSKGERKDYGCTYSGTRKKCNKKSDSFFEGIAAKLKGNTNHVLLFSIYKTFNLTIEILHFISLNHAHAQRECLYQHCKNVWCMP